jgi:WD40 repeat protein
MIAKKEQLKLANKKAVRTLDINSPSGQFVIGQSSDDSKTANLAVWDINSRQVVKEIERQKNSNILSARFSPDGKSLIYVDSTHQVSLFNFNNERTKALDIPDGNLDWLSFSYDKDRFVAAGALTYVWDIKEGSLLWTSPKEAVSVVQEGQSALGCFLSSGERVALGGMVSGKIVIYDVISGNLVGHLPNGPMKAVRWIAVDPNDKYLAVVNYEDQSLMLWNLHKQERHLPSLNISGFLSLAFHPSGEYLALGMISGYVAIIKTQTGESIFSDRIHKRRVWDLAFSQDGDLLLTGGEGGACLCYLRELA